jgi:hypothetical protein
VHTEEPRPTEEARAVLGPVLLTFPADSRMARVARLAATALGSVAGFTVDDNDDLRIAVDELVVMSIEGGSGGGVTMRFSIADGEVRVEAETDAADDLSSNPERFMLSEQILGVVTDWYAVSATDGVLTAAFTKSAS